MSTPQRPREYASDLLARSALILARSALILAREAPLNAYEVNACRRRRCARSVVVYAPGVLNFFIRNRNKGVHRHLCIQRYMVVFTQLAIGTVLNWGVAKLRMMANSFEYDSVFIGSMARPLARQMPDFLNSELQKSPT